MAEVAEVVLDLYGVPAEVTGEEFAKVQFLNEYGFAESVYNRG